jgi:alpha-glucosidase
VISIFLLISKKKKMLDKLQQCLDNGVNVSAVWIQDWAGKIVTSFGYRVFWNWRWNEELYPGLRKVTLTTKIVI